MKIFLFLSMMFLALMASAATVKTLDCQEERGQIQTIKISDASATFMGDQYVRIFPTEKDLFPYGLLQDTRYYYSGGETAFYFSIPESAIAGEGGELVLRSFLGEGGHADGILGNCFVK